MVDAIVGLLAIEEVGNKFDNTRNTSGTTDQDDFKHVQLVNRRVMKHLLNRFKGTSEEILAELFETSTSKGSVEINSLEKRVNFNGCLGSRRKGMFSTLTSSAEGGGDEEHGHLKTNLNNSVDII